MATNIPAPLKSADVSRFVIRAAQIEKLKPAAAYWCYYYVLEKILGEGLHRTDEQCSQYVMSLMDKVEQMKEQHPEDDAMRDDIAGKAYMEQFALETFLRADNAIRANKASKQTADTFQAAYTFLDALNIWQPVDPDITTKIKYAKFHAVRIAKAIKAGEDPNLTNPAPESDLPPPPALDANDPEVQAINGLGQEGPGSTPLPAGVGAHAEAPPPFVDQPPVVSPDVPPSLPSAPHGLAGNNEAESYYQSAPHSDVSPLPASEGGGYFPQVPPPAAPHLPGPPTGFHDAPPHFPSGTPSSFSQISHSGIPPQFSPPPQQPPSQVSPPAPIAYRPPPHQMPVSPPPVQPAAQPMFPPQPPPPQPPPPQPPQIPLNTQVDDEAMARSQKHARFAISALNFEDVNTAVKELRLALAELGAR